MAESDQNKTATLTSRPLAALQTPADVAKTLIHEIEHSWARLDHTQRASLDLKETVEKLIRPRAAEERLKQGRQEASSFVAQVRDVIESADLPEHFRVQRHLIMPQVIETLTVVAQDAAALLPLPRLHMPHLLSRKSSTKGGEKSSKHKRILSLGTFKRSIVPISSRPICQSGNIDKETWAFETAVACGLPHSVPSPPANAPHEPRDALDIVADDGRPFGHKKQQEPLRELVVLTAGKHRAEDVAELF